ncbi:MAG: hypothetical protein ACFFAZ_05395 [Promethearchaeota archaeon]
MKRFAAVLGGGGHSSETLSLVDLLGGSYAYFYLINVLDRLTPKKIRIPGMILPVFAPRLLPQDSRIMSVIRTLITFLLSIIYFLIYRPVAVVSCGGGITVPVFFAARATGVKTVFIESMARVDTLSITGRMLLHKTDLFFVQWEALATRTPGTIYGGQLL